jgi:hypothetical protein
LLVVQCDESGNNRLHITNLANVAGITVEATAGGRTHTPGELPFDETGCCTGVNFLVTADIGDRVSVTAERAGLSGGATCIVTDAAVSQAENASHFQTFVNVLVGPVRVECDLGLEPAP